MDGLRTFSLKQSFGMKVYRFIFESKRKFLNQILENIMTRVGFISVIQRVN